MMNMVKIFRSIVFLLFCSLYYPTLCPATQYSCSHDQSLLLVELNKSLTISDSGRYCNSNPKTMSWNESTDCCSWEGVTCDDITSQVIELDLSCSHLRGTIGSNSSLYHLSHLRKLNLGANDIRISQVPKIFGNFTHLTHLGLASLDVTGQLPSEILKLTELVSLDLSFTAINVEPDIFKLLLTNFTKLSQISLSNLNIISSIPKNLSSSLVVVELTGNNLQGELPQSIFHLPNLKTLVLQSNGQLYGNLPSVRWNSSATLEWLDLSGISFSGKIPDPIGNLKALKFLYLSYCGFIGSLPKGIFDYMTELEVIEFSGNKLIGSLPSFPREMKHLSWLNLAYNSFSGTIMPSWLISLSSLETLFLGFNKLYGPLPIELSSLVKLKYLDLLSNNFSGHVDLDVFSNMKQLDFLDLSHNRLSLLTKNNSTLPETITDLALASCNVTDLEFLRATSSYHHVDLSMNNIHEVPSWLWPKWEKVDYLNLSYNSITHTGEIVFQYATSLDLRSNMFHGSFPQVPNIQHLLISNNNFSGVIPPSIICRAIHLQMLDISNNSFTGSIPHCIGTISPILGVLDMRKNMLEGTIPRDFSSVYPLTLNLHGNHLRGNIPSSLAKCTNLTVLDLGNNHLNGSFPSWLGNFKKLRVLSLRSNNFHGKISFFTTSFSRLQILDLSHNQFIGTLSPNLFKSFTGMMEFDEISESLSYIGEGSSFYDDSTVVMNKGIEVELVRILKTWVTIDLSSNNFEGKIPISVGGLISVRQLNFSNNRFVGEIPISFGNLSVLESLDLSSNQLNGTIPTQLATLPFLSKLDLSHNQLTGRIPGGSQFQTFQNDSFIGNNGLCGLPLSKNCVSDEVPDLSNSLEEEDDEDSGFIDGFSWRSVVVGYGVGMLIGLGIGCLMIITRKPEWLSRIVEEEGYNILMKRNRKKILIQIGRNK